jgi:hypothetical protein
MSESVSKTVSIFLTLDRQTINSYFNAHDPAPIYMRQISHELEQYIMDSAGVAKRYSAIFYKFKCSSEVDKQYAEPLIYAIRRHFTEKKVAREKDFERFKKRTWMLLGISLAAVMLFQGVVPVFIGEDNHALSVVANSLEIFSWVLLWRPIDVLLFYWNPHLKDILLLKKLSSSEVIVIQNEK